METGACVNFLDDEGRPRAVFGFHGDTDSDGSFVAHPKVLPISDYVQSLDAALRLKGQLSFLKLQLTELEGEFLTCWKAQLFGRDNQTFEDKAAIPSVALLKVLVKQLLSRPNDLNWPKFGPP